MFVPFRICLQPRPCSSHALSNTTPDYKPGLPLYVSIHKSLSISRSRMPCRLGKNFALWHDSFLCGGGKSFSQFEPQAAIRIDRAKNRFIISVKTRSQPNRVKLSQKLDLIFLSQGWTRTIHLEDFVEPMPKKQQVGQRPAAFCYPLSDWRQQTRDRKVRRIYGQEAQMSFCRGHLQQDNILCMTSLQMEKNH